MQSPYEVARTPQYDEESTCMHALRDAAPSFEHAASMQGPRGEEMQGPIDDLTDTNSHSNANTTFIPTGATQHSTGVLKHSFSNIHVHTLSPHYFSFLVYTLRILTHEFCIEPCIPKYPFLVSFNVGMVESCGLECFARWSSLDLGLQFI